MCWVCEKTSQMLYFHLAWRFNEDVLFNHFLPQAVIVLVLCGPNPLRGLQNPAHFLT